MQTVDTQQLLNHAATAKFALDRADFDPAAIRDARAAVNTLVDLLVEHEQQMMQLKAAAADTCNCMGGIFAPCAKCDPEFNARLEQVRNGMRPQDYTGAIIVEPESVEVKPTKERCPHYHLIKRTMAIIADAGLSQSKAAMLPAINCLLGTDYKSRSQLKPFEWERVGNQVKLGWLTW